MMQIGNLELLILELVISNPMDLVLHQCVLKQNGLLDVNLKLQIQVQDMACHFRSCDA
jgi:hypothetical protein